MTDILKEAPAYRWMTDDAREEGLRQGLEEGLERGLKKGQAQQREAWLEQSRGTVLEIVAGRFPKMLRLAKKLVRDATDVERLQQVIVKISLAHEADDIEQYLWELDEPEAQ